MRVYIVLFALTFITLASCKGRKGEIIGSWRGTKFENADMDSFFLKSQQYIDTIGKNGDAKVNWELYGVTNMDSLRKDLQMQQDSAKNLQYKSILNTVFTFNKDGILLISFNKNMDTSKWAIEDDKTLTLEEMTGRDKGTKTSVGIISITESEMKLKFMQDSAFSTVTFVRDSK
ncbi:MAG: hypothetical protein H7257_01580 [Taibaiella sp.]|nr:hypothetical protein [Taibaiella sp.]